MDAETAAQLKLALRVNNVGTKAFELVLGAVDGVTK